jgi:hypothetical protein
MVNTGERTKVESVGTMTTAIAGRWAVYAVTLNPVEVATLEAAKFMGFSKANAENRTTMSQGQNVRKAPVDYYTGSYNSTAATLESLEDKIFVIADTAYAANSVFAYVGAWETEAVYTQGKDDVITINFAAPTAIKDYYAWNNVEFYYGNEGGYLNTNRLTMTKTDRTYTMNDVGDMEYATAGEWAIYELKLTVAQMAEIQDSQYAGFIKADSFVRTKSLSSRNVLRASKVEYSESYGKKTSLDSLDGYTFVIQGFHKGGFEPDSYIGSWLASDLI